MSCDTHVLPACLGNTGAHSIHRWHPWPHVFRVPFSLGDDGITCSNSILLGPETVLLPNWLSQESLLELSEQTCMGIKHMSLCSLEPSFNEHQLKIRDCILNPTAGRPGGLILTQDQRKLCYLWSTFLTSQLVTNHIHPSSVPNNPKESKNLLLKEGYAQNVQKLKILKS